MHSEGQYTLEKGTLEVNSGEILFKINLFDTTVGFLFVFKSRFACLG